MRRSFYGWRDNGLPEKLTLRHVAAARLSEGRTVAPTASVIDTRHVKTTQSGEVRGYDTGKRSKGRKRHITLDPAGLLISLIVHGAKVQDRDGAPVLLPSIASTYPLLRHVLQIADMPDPNREGYSQRADGGRCRSSNARTRHRVLQSFRADGSSNAFSRGSDGAAEW